MKDTDPAMLLADLRASLERIRTLLAWQDLRRSESEPDQPTSFAVHDSAEIDLRNEYSFFKNAMAPSWIWSDSPLMASVPDGWPFT